MEHTNYGAFVGFWPGGPLHLDCSARCNSGGGLGIRCAEMTDDVRVCVCVRCDEAERLVKGYGPSNNNRFNSQILEVWVVAFIVHSISNDSRYYSMSGDFRPKSSNADKRRDLRERHVDRQ